METEMVRCNNCMKIMNEDNLEIFESPSGYLKGCPDCKTDSYLMDVIEYVLSVHNINTDEVMSTTNCLNYDESIKLVAEEINAQGWDLLECRVYEGDIQKYKAANLYIVEELLSYLIKSKKNYN